jgi:hypothetical protein
MSDDSESELPWSPQLAHELRTLQFALDFVDSVKRVKFEQQEHKERALVIAQGIADSINKTVVAEQGPPTLPTSQPRGSMTNRHTITDVKIGSNVIKIDVTVQDDGGLNIFDGTDKLISSDKCHLENCVQATAVFHSLNALILRFR